MTVRHWVVDAGIDGMTNQLCRFRTSLESPCGKKHIALSMTISTAEKDPAWNMLT